MRLFTGILRTHLEQRMNDLQPSFKMLFSDLCRLIINVNKQRICNNESLCVANLSVLLSGLLGAHLIRFC